MKRRHWGAFALCAAIAFSATANAEQPQADNASTTAATPPAATAPAPASAATETAPATTTAPETTDAAPAPANDQHAVANPQNPIVDEIRTRLAATPIPDNAAEERDRAALVALYRDRNDGPLWIAGDKLNPAALDIAAEFEASGDYGLDPAAFQFPAHDGETLKAASPEARADAELEISRAVLLYARHARGGRIPEPAEMLNTNLDRKPQLLEPDVVLSGLVSAPDKRAYLRSLHPKHPQFELLRQAYLEARAKSSNGQLSATAKRLRANMEMWRWMWDDLGDLYVFNNIPEYMQRVYRRGEVIRSEKIVAGLIDKQSSVFSRPLKYVVLRPTWRVPESIMVHELWPSLIRGGGYMYQYGLEIQTKDGRTVDWRKLDWTKTNIADYNVIQPPGPKSVLGRVKFSFPSQHTIFMHDTPDKWMFRSAQRTLSHGCLRVQNPMELAEIILAEDKGWTPEHIAELSRSGPLNNEIVIDKKIPIHLAYFTAWADDSGKIKYFRDVYGHEKRVTQALDGQWDKINKGRDHLAPVTPGFNPAALARSTTPARAKRNQTAGDILSTTLGMIP